MTDRVAGLHMHPHLGNGLDRGIRHESEFVAVAQLLDMSIAPRKYRPMDRRSKERRLAVRKRWGRCVHPDSTRGTSGAPAAARLS